MRLTTLTSALLVTLAAAAPTPSPQGINTNLIAREATPEPSWLSVFKIFSKKAKSKVHPAPPPNPPPRPLINFPRPPQ
ncbi:hypothetical protein Slin15195_G104950 [Septoria linicola]|uniref:Uncharacterized protein n=1 Tax=Septoria linicola TaxID=215465 RepID=A0A9Q9B6E9_9PEZI|nr:hypothetical protein Slin14017_G068010 [Septoria linicola]USW57176.1 hypothetical protein Slin15195_G104950 [Septoria linicola]